MIRTRGLAKHYRDITAISEVSFTVNKGEIVGFLGPNGAGKSTTLKILTGFIPASAGEAEVAGYDVFEAPIEVKRRLGYLPEIPPVYPDLTVYEYLTFVAAIKGQRGASAHNNIDEVMQRVHLTEVKSRLIGNLSKGYQQRTGLAQALLGKPEVVILDEPTVGLDIRQIGELRALIKDLARDLNLTILLSTHILQEVTAICQRVIVINQGRIVADDPLTHLVAKHRKPDREPSLEEIFLSLTEA